MQPYCWQFKEISDIIYITFPDTDEKNDAPRC